MGQILGSEPFIFSPRVAISHPPILPREIALVRGQALIQPDDAPANARLAADARVWSETISHVVRAHYEEIAGVLRGLLIGWTTACGARTSH